MTTRIRSLTCWAAVADSARLIQDVLRGEARFTVICDRVENVEPLLPDGCAHLMPTDGPYHGVKSHGWDNEHKSDVAFLNWKRERYAAWKRILAPNGTLYDFASPQMGARVEVACCEFFSVVANIRWNKRVPGRTTAANKLSKESLRVFFHDSETIVMAEPRGFIFEPLRAYLDGERERAGIKRTQVHEAWCAARGTKGNMVSHWFGAIQWALPTNENHEWLRSLLNANGGNFLARPYEELRTQYEELRRPFNVTPEDQYTDVWTYPTVPYRKDKHPCEKPEAMARDIVRISSRPNDVVLVFFSGSGIFASEALKQGRRVIAVEMDPQWAAVTERRCIEAINGQASTMTAPCMPPMRRKATRANTPPQLSLFQHILVEESIVPSRFEPDERQRSLF